MVLEPYDLRTLRLADDDPDHTLGLEIASGGDDTITIHDQQRSESYFLSYRLRNEFDINDRTLFDPLLLST
jgi:hypothetical protein